jgi:hypothetical protein
MLWSLQWSYLPIQPFFGPHAVWYVSYQSLSRSWHTDLDYGWYRLSNVEIGLTAGVTGQQRMLTPPWHLIPPLIYSEVRVRPFSDLYFLLDLRYRLLIVIFVISFLRRKMTLGSIFYGRHLILPLVLPEVRVSLIFTVDHSMYLISTLVLTADFSALPD